MSGNGRVTVCVLIVCTLVLAIGSVMAASGAPYTLDSEDVVVVTVLNHVEFSGEFLVPPSGMLNLPVVGEVRAAGMTIEDLTSYITSHLKDRLVSPEVTVSLKIPRALRVSVLGAVAKPGTYEIKQDWRVSEALSAAGGLNPDFQTAECKVVLLRAGTGKREVAGLSDVLRQGSASNFPVSNGDVVTLDPGEMIPIYVTGKVKNPGLFKMKSDSAGVLEALAVAGGTLDEASLSNVTVTHLSGSKDVLDLSGAMVEGKQLPSLRLQSGDLVLVPETTKRVAVLGFVAQPGIYPLKDGQKQSLSDVLGMAKGMDNRRAGLTSVAVIRVVDGKQVKTVYDVQKFLRKGDTAQNPEIRAGDVVYVPETNKLDWEPILRGMSAIGVMLNPFIK